LPHHEQHIPATSSTRQHIHIASGGGQVT